MFFSRITHRSLVTFWCGAAGLGLSLSSVWAQDSLQQERERGRVMSAVKKVEAKALEGTKALLSNGSSGRLPIWTYFTESTRDNQAYTGVMVGRDPFQGGGSASVPTKIVPLIVVTHLIATGLGSNGKYITKPGLTKFDPTVPNRGCLTAPNDVPLTLLRQSPLFEKANFNFGGTHVGTTQYVNAFQRAEFWRALGEDAKDYQVLFSPVDILAPVVIDVPAKYGLARPAHLPGYTTLCGPQARIDIDWFDTYLNSVLLPSFPSQAGGPSSLPLFLVHDTVWSSPADDPYTCCILGYHSGTNSVPIQPYVVADFETTGIFPISLNDILPTSHELAEFVNDPFISNTTPPWGISGSFCDPYLEVGDWLVGEEAPRIVMPNGFTYHLQEMGFFSWFFGAPSVGIHGWFSNNGTLLTDAGPPCHSSSASAGADFNTKWIIR